jgi:hypothetical protein
VLIVTDPCFTTARGHDVLLHTDDRQQLEDETRDQVDGSRISHMTHVLETLEMTGNTRTDAKPPSICPSSCDIKAQVLDLTPCPAGRAVEHYASRYPDVPNLTSAALLMRRSKRRTAVATTASSWERPSGLEYEAYVRVMRNGIACRMSVIHQHRNSFSYYKVFPSLTHKTVSGARWLCVGLQCSLLKSAGRLFDPGLGLVFFADARLKKACCIIDTTQLHDHDIITGCRHVSISLS